MTTKKMTLRVRDAVIELASAPFIRADAAVAARARARGEALAGQWADAHRPKAPDLEKATARALKRAGKHNARIEAALAAGATPAALAALGVSPRDLDEQAAAARESAQKRHARLSAEVLTSAEIVGEVGKLAHLASEVLESTQQQLGARERKAARAAVTAGRKARQAVSASA